MYFLKAHSEAYQPTEEEKIERERRFAIAQQKRDRKLAIETGLSAFQAKDYAAVVAAIEPFADDLDNVAAAKLKYARKKTG